MKYIISIILLSASIGLSNASVSSGTINPSFKTTKVCQDVSCANLTAYTLNMAPSGVTQVTIDDTNGVDGVAFGSSIGWLTFDPTGPEGVTINPTTGVLSGKGWSQGSGWVNFSVTGQQVAINSNGEFTGWAWTGGTGGGWIKFDCSDPQACIKTDWRPIPSRSTSTPVVPSSGGSGGGIISSYVDVCPNLPDQQYNVPAGYGLSGGVCTLINDKCSNLVGAQSEVPAGYTVDQGGLCMLKALDMCPNISGVQSLVPKGKTIDVKGDCVDQAIEDEKLPILKAEDAGTTIQQIDMCANILGLQVAIPSGLTRDSNNTCLPATTDYCPNIPDIQSEVPTQLIVNIKGECVAGLTKIDVNPITANNSGTLIKSVGDNKYVLPLTPGDDSAKGNMISYPFIPESFKIGLKMDPVAKLVTSDEELATNGGVLPQVDLTSTLSTTAVIIFIIVRLFGFLFLA
jgi:hypothetical protein